MIPTQSPHCIMQPSLSNLLSGAASSGVKPPVVIQEFVDHGGVLFKVRRT